MYFPDGGNYVPSAQGYTHEIARAKSLNVENNEKLLLFLEIVFQ